MSIEFVRLEHFVPPLRGTDDRHLLIDSIGRVSFYHYDPYAQVLSKVLRGFERDMDDARSFARSGFVDPTVLRRLVEEIPPSAYSRYPSLSQRIVLDAVTAFTAPLARTG
jgi:hypothetical protein